MVMLDNSGMENDVLANYTLTPNMAVGYRGLYDRNTNAMFHGAQVDGLLKRWNNPDSQGNLYVSGAIGLIDQPARANDFAEPASLFGLQADWESRRYYTSYITKFKFAADDAQREFTQSARVGIAPYIAEAGSVHSWLMLQIDHQPEDAHDTVMATPLVRLFYNSYLVEAGYNLQNHHPLINATIRF